MLFDVGWFSVDQGRIAQHNAAAEISAAAFLGKSNQITTQRCPLTEVRTFFKDNPGWE